MLIEFCELLVYTCTRRWELFPINFQGPATPVLCLGFRTLGHDGIAFKVKGMWHPLVPASTVKATFPVSPLGFRRQYVTYFGALLQSEY